MKSWKFIGMIILSLFVSLNFTSCTKGEVEGNELANEWLLKSDKSSIVDKNTNEELSYDDEFISYQEKIIIKNLSDNKYSVQWYSKDGEQWEEDGDIVTYILKDNKLIPENKSQGEMTLIIEKVSSSELVLIIDEEDENYKYYEKMVFIRC